VFDHVLRLFRHLPLGAALRALLLPLLAVTLQPLSAVHAVPAPRQKAPVQFRCEAGAVWMANCNECRCQRDNRVVCTHLACLRGALVPARAPTPPRAVPETASDAVNSSGSAAAVRERTACYQGSCPAPCDSRLDDSGCRICDCDVAGADIMAMTSTPREETNRWGFLTVARSLGSHRP